MARFARMYVTLTSQTKLAYIGLVEPDVDWADEAGVDAMHALILDSDAKGRLIGIEVFDAKKVLPASLIDKARRI